MTESVTSGQTRKLAARLENPVRYRLELGDNSVDLNALLEHSITLQATGNISCIHCGRSTNKSFNQGYCYPCFQKLAQCDTCVMSPEKCHYDEGTCREPVWGDYFCMQDHIVYLANSSGLKVGITRASQIPTRWIDQGASQGLAVIRVRTRQQAGYCEAMFRQHVTDRTNWRGMLKADVDPIDLVAESNRLLEDCRNDIGELQERFGIHAISVLTGVDPVVISYPVRSYPDKINSIDLEKNPAQGTLLGIKGQYLILDSGVVNIRKYTGYELQLSA
jgi:hypothetical protein